jgi:Integrase core domain
LRGARNSHVATLVERHSRFCMLVNVSGKDTATVVAALSRHVQQLPPALRRSLTWDRGLEMAQHKSFTMATDVKVYFCDPQSPWQRGSNENTNGLLRQYLPKTADLSSFSQSELDEIALRLNTRPRQTLAFAPRRINCKPVLHRLLEITGLMREGAWINIKTGKFEWITEHCDWIKVHGNAQKIGLPEEVFERIKDMPNDHSGPKRERILHTVMGAAFIRVRGHGSWIAIKFTAVTEDASRACRDFLGQVCGPYSVLRFNNVGTNESLELTYQEFENRMGQNSIY